MLQPWRYMCDRWVNTVDAFVLGREYIACRLLDRAHQAGDLGPVDRGLGRVGAVADLPQ